MRSLPQVGLRRGPFTVAEARQVGVRWRDLQKAEWVRTSRGQYAWAGLPQDVRLKLIAVARRAPAGYAFSGLTAAWILGLEPTLIEPIEITVPREIPIRARVGAKVRRAALSETDVITREGLPTTSPLRTACDLGSRPDLVECVVAVDLALHAGPVTLAQLERHVAANSGAKGIRRLRYAVKWAEPRSESPMESRLRMELVRARLPRPLVQAELCDAGGGFLAPVDLYYPDRRLAIEYDGTNHRDRMEPNLRRQNAILTAGFHLLRFTAPDLRQRGSVAAQVRHARAALPA
jgi:very-short-patch-repair endonuclease